MKETDLFRYVNWLQEMTYDEMMTTVRAFYQSEHFAMSIIRKQHEDN
jgi:hypothetical protein